MLSFLCEVEDVFKKTEEQLAEYGKGMVELLREKGQLMSTELK